MTGFGKWMRGAAVAGACVVVAACGQDASTVVPTAPAAPGPEDSMAAGQALGTGSEAVTAIVLVECRKEVGGDLRSKISVNGKNLASGTYRARVTSPGKNPIVSPAKQTIGDEVEFDFDSKVDPGEVFIPADYITIVPNGPDVRGEIFTSAGQLVGRQLVNCEVQ
jgi:hypothetical protein